MKVLQLRSMSVLIFVLIFGGQANAGDINLTQKLEKGSSSYGVQVGMGFTEDIPGPERPDLSFLFFFPNYQYNLTGLIGDSWYQGTLNWHIEAGFASILNRDGEYLVGVSPLMMQYKFADPKRRWAPNILLGAGFSLTDWDEAAPNEVGGDFQFLLNAGAGLEIFGDAFDYSINYRFFHVSNAGIENPNVGVNAHVISLGLQF